MKRRGKLASGLAQGLRTTLSGAEVKWGRSWPDCSRLKGELTSTQNKCRYLSREKRLRGKVGRRSGVIKGLFFKWKT